MINSLRWIDGTLDFVFERRSGPERGQIALYDTDTGQVRTLTNDAGDKTYPYAWRAPEHAGQVLLLALVDRRTIAIYRTGKPFWERIATLPPPPGARHPYVGSAEPFIADGRSYISFVVKSEDVRTRAFEDAEVWITGIDPKTRFALRCDDGAYPLMRFDPETFRGRDEVFVYYNTRQGRGIDIYRCRTGLRP